MMKEILWQYFREWATGKKLHLMTFPAFKFNMRYLSKNISVESLAGKEHFQKVFCKNTFLDFKSGDDICHRLIKKS